LNEEKKSQMSSRTKFLLLVGVFVVPVVAAYLAYFGWRPAGHKNYGELISVTPLQQTQGSLLDGEDFGLEQLQGKWLMLHVGPAACDAGCERQLYLMRQIRIAQGKGQSRIERVWVLTDAGVPAARLLEEYAGMYVWRPGSASFAAQFPAPQSPSDHIYIVDPLGNVMLRFPVDPDPKGIMKDLKQLLKASQIG
jgi:cytochrome oxidase Cu insertion factor (SCO1/SenC/PrrC family)